jgi:hypothetical protein
MFVWALPAVSDTEKPMSSLKRDPRVGPPAVAVETAAMVHTFAALWFTVIEEMYSKSKSTLLDVDNVEQSIGSFPVKVNSMLAVLEVAEVAARVRVGGVVSGAAPGV